MRVHLQGDRVRIGRRGDLELVLDPDQDLEVSALHAELSRTEAGWTLRDRGSRNGTFLNGQALGLSPTTLSHGDQIRLGPKGPLLELFLDEQARARQSAENVSPTATVTAPEPQPQGASGTQVQRRLRRATRRLRWILAATVVLLVMAGGALFYTARERAEWSQERAALEARADSLLASEAQATQALEGELSELDEALERSREELESVRSALAARDAQSSPDPQVTTPEPSSTDGEEGELRRRLQEATAALERQQIAASLDFDGIQDANRQAVAMVFAEHPGGTVATGTGFSVEASGILITSRHVLLGEDGSSSPTRIAVQFTDSSQVFPASLLAVSSDWDLAAIQVENLVGEVPTVAGLNLRPDTLSSGVPMASLGFPLGGEMAEAGGERSPARPLLSAGVLLGRSSGQLEIQGYGEPGASGSPIFDAQGHVAGILFGGRRDGDRRVLLAVPAPVATSLLQAIRDGR